MWPTHYIPKQDRIEGVPPPRYYLTTPPYPLEITESLAANSTDPEAYIVPAAETGEEMTSSGEPVDGLLKDILIRYEEWPPEAITSEAEPVSGVLNDILVRYEGPPEELTSAGEPVSGAIVDILVRYENWPLGVATESLASSGAPVSGVLA